jgi:hypothetical protein
MFIDPYPPSQGVEVEDEEEDEEEMRERLAALNS